MNRNIPLPGKVGRLQRDLKIERASTVGRRTRTFFWLLLMLGASSMPAKSQPGLEPYRLIDSPTAGLVDKGRFASDLRLFPDGGVVGQLSAGVLRRLTISIAFGGTNIIGDDDIDWYPRVEPSIRYRIVEETSALPAATLGYETQGYGVRHEERYQVKSKGFFVAFSKNYASSFGQFGVHGGLNLTRESSDDGDLSGWAGIDKSINEELVLLGEYDFALNDNEDESLGSGKGFLNAGAYWSTVPNISIGFLLKNILGNGDGDKGPDPDMSRELSVRYTEEF